jgi:hypothetical protein
LVNSFNDLLRRATRVRVLPLFAVPAAMLSLLACAHAADGRDGGAYVGCGAVTDGRGAEVSGRAGGARVATRIHRQCAERAAKGEPANRPTTAQSAQTKASTPAARIAAADATPIRPGPVNLPRAAEAPSAVKGDLVRAGATVVTGGALIWLVHSGVWATLLLLGVPLWRHVDLLPIVSQSPGQQQACTDGAAESKEDSAVVRVIDARLNRGQGAIGAG